MARLSRTRRVLYSSASIGVILISTLIVSRVLLLAKVRELTAEKELLSVSARQMHGEYLTLTASYHLNASDYCLIISEPRQAADHSSIAIQNADQALSVLSALENDQNRNPWHRLQFLNHLGLANCIKGILLADQQGAHNRKEALESLERSSKYYEMLLERRNSLTREEESRIAQPLMALLKDVQWYRALCASVRARLTQDQGDLGNAYEQVKYIKTHYQNICPVEDNRRFRWVIAKATQ